MKVAVTGANGRIGSALLARFVEIGGFEPIGVCRNAMGAALVDGIPCQVRIGSTEERESAQRLLGDCDAVVNCAWAVGLPGESIRRNEAIMRSICSVSRVTTTVFLSSIAIYGACIDATRSTFSRPRPDSSYGRVKQRLERRTAEAAADKRWVVLRLGHVYGPHQWLSREIVDLVQDPTFQLPFDGARPSNALHVDHLASVVAALVSGADPSGAYNVSDDPPRTWRELFDWHSEALGLPRARGMPPDASAAWRTGLIGRSRRPLVVNVGIDVARWLGALAFDSLSTRETVRELALSVLIRAPRPVADWIKSAHGTRVARQYIRALSGRVAEPRPWHGSDAIPGAYLMKARGKNAFSGAASEGRRRLWEWYAAISDPGLTIARRDSNTR